MKSVHRNGFTLVETMLAMAVFGVALGACILSVSMAMRTVSTAGNQMAAVHALRNEMEILRTNTFYYSKLKAGTYPWTNAMYTGPAGTSTVIGTYTVTSNNVNMKTIVVSVGYRNYIHRGYTTNSLASVMTSTLHQ